MNSYGPTPVHPGPSQNPGNDINSGGYSGSYYIRYYFQTDAQFNALIVSLFLLALITFLGNIVVLLSTVKGKLYKYHVYKFLISLQISDLINTVTMCGVLYNALKEKEHRTWYQCYMAHWACEVFGLVGNLCSLQSGWTVCIILLDRMYVLADPFGYRLRSSKDFVIVISLVWAGCIIFCCIPLCGVGEYQYLHDFLMCQVSLGNVPTTGSIAWHCILILFVMCLPLVCILLCYCVARPILLFRSRQEGHSPVCRVRMFDLVVLVHVLCTWPLYISVVMDQINVTFLHRRHMIPEVFWLISYILVLGNSALNPFVYGLSNKKIINVITNTFAGKWEVASSAFACSTRSTAVSRGLQ